MFVRLCADFFSFSVLGVISSVKVFQWCFKNVLGVFEVSKMFPVNWCLKKVSRKFQWCFKQESFKEVSGKFQGCFKFQACFK